MNLSSISSITQTTWVSVAIFATCIGVALPVQSADDAQTSDSSILEDANQQLKGSYTRITQVKNVNLKTDSKFSFVHSVKKNICYRLLATTGTSDTQFFMQASLPSPVKVDQKSHDITSCLSFCSDETRNVRFEFRTSDSQATVAFALFARDNIVRDEIQTSEQAAVEALRVLTNALEGNPKPIGAPLSGVLKDHEKAHHNVLLSEAACYLFVATGTLEKQDLSLRLRVDNREVAADRITGTTPRVQWCAPGATEVEVELSMYGNHGAYAISVLRTKTSQSSTSLRVGGYETDLIANRIRQLHTMKDDAMKPVSPVFRASATKGESREFPVRLKSGTCYVIIASSETNLREMEISLNSNPQRSITLQKSGFLPLWETNPCATRSEDARLLVRITEGAGQFGVQLFAIP